MMFSMKTKWPAVLAVAALCFPVVASADQWIKADRVHIGDGRVIDNGVVHFRDGKIIAVGSGLAIPEGADVIDLKGHEITPGLIDANAKVEPGDLLPPRRKNPRQLVRELLGVHDVEGSERAAEDEHDERWHEYQVCPSWSSHRADEICPICGGESDDPEDHPDISGMQLPARAISEQSSEVVPHTAVLDLLDLESPDFGRLLRGGVTTVYAAPDPSAVIGARGAILRTFGENGPVVMQPDGAVKAVLGSDAYAFGSRNGSPSRRGVTHFSRRPQSRMGVGWIFRKAFFDARLRAAGGTPTGADTASAEASEVLQRVLAGDVPMRVQARTASDIETAFRLCGEFEVSFTLVDPVEAYRVLPLLESAKIPVIYGPIFDRAPRSTLAATNFTESRRARLHTVKDLVDAGIPTALSAQDLREEDGLARQAMLAQRSGVSAAKALELVTLAPAKILGVDAEVGSIENGKRADLVIWNGAPFAATSRTVAVYVDGRLAHGEL